MFRGYFMSSEVMAVISKKVPAMWRYLFICGLLPVIFPSKLNEPIVLLPYHSTLATNFTLEVSDGCYTWRASRPEIASVTPQGVSDVTACSSSAIVTAVSKTPSRLTSVVIAENPVSGHRVRCDVIVDVIHAIDIESTTRELYLQEAPEEFNIRALDDEGNVFTSLDGVSFEWSLIPDTDVDLEKPIDAHNILRIIPFKESNYDTPEPIQALESQGKQGDRILVKGIRTGSARVSAKLQDPVYKTVKDQVVRLIVRANIMLNPPLVYLMRHSVVHYKVELLKHGITQEIPMPSQQYYLELKDDSICRLEGGTASVEALELGNTEIILKDKNIKLKDSFRQATAGIYVVVPAYLGFTVMPGRKWILETGRVYEITVEIFDRDSHKIFASDNVHIVVTFPKEYFEILSFSNNGTYFVVKTLQRGTTELEGVLSAIIKKDGSECPMDPIVKNNQDVDIFDPIVVSPQILVFPFDPAGVTQSYNFKVKATGGSGNYTWTSQTTSVAVVNVMGEITTKGLGETQVVAADLLNTAYTGFMVTYVLPPTEIKFLPSKVEAVIGSYLELPLAMFGLLEKEGKKVEFEDCRYISLSISIDDKAIFEHMPATLAVPENGCTTVRVNARKLGSTVVTAEYVYHTTKLKASVTIAAYKPLRPVDPEAQAVVTVGASKEILFEGGPQAWVLDHSKYYQKANTDNPDIVTMYNQKPLGIHKTFHAIRVLCRDLGEQPIELTIGNGVTAKNQYPAKAKSSVMFVCAEPKGLHLIPVLQHPDGLPPCPIVQDSDEPIPVPNFKDFDILVNVTDGSGRRFDNFSSLSFSWELSNETVARFARNGEMAKQILHLDSMRKVIRTYQTVLTQKKLGSLRITATIGKYIKSYFQLEKITFPQVISPSISSQLELYLVQEAEIIPNSISLYNHPSRKEFLTVQKGSGYFHLDLGQTGIADVSYDPKSRKIEVVPLHEGLIHITAYDLCLESDSHASAQIMVSDINRIQLRVVDKVEVYKEIKASVQVLDKNGKPILASHFPVMSLKHKTGSSIISVRPDVEKSKDLYTAKYIIDGLSLGRTTLQFQASPNSGSVIHSSPKEIQVFPPLRLDPRNITILVGALFQVTAHGGPQPQSTIEFSIKDSKIAGVSNSGVIDASVVGNTVVVGRAVGYESETGEMVVYSKDEVSVYVVQLEGIRIFSPLKKLRTGTWMPLYAMGANEHETPFTFGSVEPPLQFQWTVNNKDVVQLQHVYHKSGIHVPEDNDFAMRLYAQKAGRVAVKLRVTPTEGSKLQIKGKSALTHEVQIQVFEKLELISPETCDGSLIMTPNTEAPVKTNRDGSGKLTYRIQPTEGCKEPVVTINEAGLLTASQYTGKANLIITSHEDFEINQTMVILIKVKHVSYLMLNADTEIKTRSTELLDIPIGSTLHFTVSFHDDMGVQFFATNTQLKYRVNRFDLLHVSTGSQNNTLVARATDIGQTVLKVWDQNNPRKADYINVRVGYAIFPSQSEVTLGDVVCFHSPIVAQEGHSGTWSSGTNAIYMEQQSGIGFANNIGSSMLKYALSESMITYTEVTVSPVDQVLIHNENIQYLSNVPTRSNRATFVTVVLEGEGIRKHTNLLGVNCSDKMQADGYLVRKMPFSCEVQMSNYHPSIEVKDLFKVTEEFDPKSGSYQCKLQQSGLHDLNQVISSMTTDIQISAVIQRHDKQPMVASKVLTIPFRPAFYTHTTEVQVSNLLPLTSIRVSASQDIIESLQVSSSDASIVEVLSPEKDGHTDNLIHYPVRFIERAALWEIGDIDIKITVISSTTGQEQIVPVRVKLIGTKVDIPQGSQQQSGDSYNNFIQLVANNYHSWAFFLFCIIATISAMFIAYHAVLGSRYQAAANQSSVFLQGTPQSAYVPSPFNSRFNTSTSPSKTRLWTSGYDLDNDSNISAYRRSPRSPFD